MGRTWDLNFRTSVAEDKPDYSLDSKALFPQQHIYMEQFKIYWHSPPQVISTVRNQSLFVCYFLHRAYSDSSSLKHLFPA